MVRARVPFPFHSCSLSATKAGLHVSVAFLKADLGANFVRDGVERNHVLECFNVLGIIQNLKSK